MLATTQHIEGYLEQFGMHTTGRGLPWLQRLRENAFARFCETGFPTTHDEDWRFTSVAAIAQTPFRLDGSIAQSLQAEPPDWQIEGAACRLVFLNGRFAPQLSRQGQLPANVRVRSLAAQLAEGPELVERHMGRYLDIQRDAFCALNTAFAEDGAYVHLPRGAVLEASIYLLFVSAADREPCMSHPRNLIVAEEDSQATIVEDYVSLAGGTVFCNPATELVAADHSVLSHYRIAREQGETFNTCTLRIQQGRSANVASHSLLLGGALVRHNVHPVLAGEGGECLINGLYVGKGRQHLDNYMRVEHASPHCASRQFYNGILDGGAHGVFHGRIIVHKDAQKTDAKQTNRNLLLSDESQIDTKPQLEIHADDVKCTHGATIGQIEEDALFYLRSRGIAEVAARKILLFAFAGECLGRMKQGAVRGHIEGLVRAALGQLALAPGGGAGAEAEGAGRQREETT